MRHTAAQVAAFTDGETRMVYARDRDAPGWADPFYLEDGGVTDALRQYTRDHLICVVPGCPSVGLVAHARSSKRDGFVHRGGSISASHTEGVFHQQAKAALLRWVRTRYPRLRAQAEVTLRDGDTLRRPDVLVTFPTGQRVALEVQYSDLTVAQWHERHDAYARLGVVDVWLLGHAGPQMHVRGTKVYPNELARTIEAAGLPVLWINPLLDALATSAHPRSPVRAPSWKGWPVRFADGANGLVLPAPTVAGPADLLISPLHAAVLTPDGIRTADLALLAANAARLDGIDRLREEVIEQVRAAMEDHAARQREALEQARLEREQAQALLHDRLEAARESAQTLEGLKREAAEARLARLRAAELALARQDAPVLSERRRAAADRLEPCRVHVEAELGQVPAWLGVAGHGFDVDMALYWQWHAYRALIQRGAGRYVTVWDVYTAVRDLAGACRSTGNAVRAWLEVMTRHSLLSAVDKDHFVVMPPPEGTLASPAVSGASTADRCRWCGLPMAADLVQANLDAHIGCDPPRR